jgi:hypothetical protein
LWVEFLAILQQICGDYAGLEVSSAFMSLYLNKAIKSRTHVFGQGVKSDFLLTVDH